MKRIACWIPLLLLATLAVHAASDIPIAGKWNCHSVDERGTEVAWTLDITDQTGKLGGVLTLTQTGEKLDILEPTLKGKVFTFKIQINPDEVVELTVHLDGEKFEGTFKGKSSGSGTVKGTLQR